MYFCFEHHECCGKGYMLCVLGLLLYPLYIAAILGREHEQPVAVRNERAFCPCWPKSSKAIVSGFPPFFHDGLLSLSFFFIFFVVHRLQQRLGLVSKGGFFFSSLFLLPFPLFKRRLKCVCMEGHGDFASHVARARGKLRVCMGIMD